MKITDRTIPKLMLLCALLSQLTACSSPIIIHKNPLSDPVTDPNTLPVTETAAPADTELPSQTESAGDTEPSAPAPADPETLAKEALSALRRDDLDGMNLIIATADNSAVFGDSFDGDNAASTVLPQLREARTRLVEERYNVRILTFSYDKESLYTEIKNAYLSDVPYVSDFYAIPYDQLGRFQAAGLLLNLRTLPFTDFTQDYFDADAMEAMSAGYGIWGAVGDYTFSPENYFAVYFNKPLSTSLSLTSPYASVRDGSWTWETFLSASKTARASLDEKGNALWGDNLTVLGLDRCESMLLASSGFAVTDAGLDRTPTLRTDAGALTDIAAFLKSAVYRSDTSPDSSLPAVSLFTSGDMLFWCGTLASMSAWADIETPWGIVPLPKTDSTQKGYNTYVGETAVFCVPSTNGALEATGTILQALFAASAYTYKDAYLNEALAYYVRDSETVDMLDLICDSAHYDFTGMFASGYSYLGYASTYAIHSAITQNYAAATVFTNYRPSAAKQLAAAFPTE